MKVRILVVVGWLISLTCACFAQDVIVTKDARKINAKVTEVNVSDIKYKNFDNLEGPTYTLLKSDVASILYQNGQVETFEMESSKPATATSISPTSPQTSSLIQIVKTENLLADMKNYNPALYSQYMSGKKMLKGGWFLASSGVVFNVGGILLYTNRYSDRWNVKEQKYDKDAFYHKGAVSGGIALISVGGLCLSASVPVLIIGGTKKNRAISNFSRQYYSLQPSAPYFQFKFYPDKAGLAYVF